MTVLSAITAAPWAITPEALQQILAIAQRQHLPDLEAAAARLAEREAKWNPQGVSTSPGSRLEGARVAVLRGATAVLPIEGPIVRYASVFSSISGATSVEVLAQDVRVALADPNVTSILLHVDSPGGEVNGIGELADLLYAARGRKPITAYVSNEGCSAAYWLASAADRIVAAPSALVGSIGVIAAVPDPEKADTDKLTFVSSQSPNKRPNPHSKGGKQQIQTVVDDLAGVFVGAVARNRGVDLDTVLAEFGQGGVFVGQAALDAGLVDAIGSFETTLAEMADAAPAQPVSAPAAPQTAAAPTPQPAQPAKRSTRMGMFERAIAWAMANPEAAADLEPEGSAESAPPVQRPAAVAAPAARTAAADPKDEEIRRLREQATQAQRESQQLRKERIQEQAEAFAETAIEGRRAFPAERDALVGQYIQAATDDTVMGPVERLDGSRQSRVDQLKAAISARPTNVLTTDSLDPKIQALFNLHENPAATPTKPGGAISDERKAQLREYARIDGKN